MNQLDRNSSWQLPDGSVVGFMRGSFDDWCVQHTDPLGVSRIPRDTDYFGDLLSLAAEYGRETVYRHFLRLYDMTGIAAANEVQQMIADIAHQYDTQHRGLAIQTLTVLYFTMMAEENRRPENRFPLKKRVKKIGVHEVLIRELNPLEAANSSKGRKARDLLVRLEAYENDDRRRLAAV